MSDAPQFVPFALEASQAMAALGAVRSCIALAESNIYSVMPEMQAKIVSLKETEAAMIGSIERAGLEIAG